MDREEELAEEIANIEKLGRENKNIDTAALIANLLARQDTESLPSKQKSRAYLVSLLMPPFGLYFVFKFLLRAEPDARRAGWVCLILTGISLFLLIILGNAVFSNPQVQSIQNLSPQDIYQLTQ